LRITYLGPDGNLGGGKAPIVVILVWLVVFFPSNDLATLGLVQFLAYFCLYLFYSIRTAKISDLFFIAVIFLFFAIASYFNGNIGTMRYASLALCVVVFGRLRYDILCKALLFASWSAAVVLAVQLSFPSIAGLTIFRAGVDEIHGMHADRYASTFLYPGDLGVLGVMLLLLSLYFSIIDRACPKKRVVLMLLSVAFIWFSQSRMAVVTLFISLAALSYVFIKRGKLLLFSGAILAIASYFLLDLSDNYLLKDDPSKIVAEFFNPSASSPFKRAQELCYFMACDDKQVRPDFFESSVVSFYDKLGMHLTLLFWLFLPLFLFVKAIIRKNDLFAASWLAIWATSFVSAPLDRPKLSLVVVITLLIAWRYKRERVQGRSII